jgi:ribosomal protein S18 acetylase RimI-like enzyme
MALLGRAFAGDPLAPFLFPDEQQRARRFARFLGIPLCYCWRYGTVACTPGLSAVSCWLPPGHTSMTTTGMLRSGAMSWALRLGWSGLRRVSILGADVDRTQRRLVAAPHWYLFVLGVEPERQRQGLGTMLLRAGLARADASRQPCYLETTNAQDVPYYEKFGFAALGEETIPRGDLRYWPMVRRPG